MVQDIDEKNGIVKLYNPHGATNPPPVPGAIQTMKLSEFQERLTCVFAETKATNDGKISFTPPKYADIERSANHHGRNPDEPIMLHVTPPQTETAQPALATSKSTPTIPPPDLRVVEQAIERSRESRPERSLSVTEQAGQAALKRDPSAAKSGYKVPGKDDDLIF